MSPQHPNRTAPELDQRPALSKSLSMKDCVGADATGGSDVVCADAAPRLVLMRRWAGSGAGDGATFVSASDRRKCPARRSGIGPSRAARRWSRSSLRSRSSFSFSPPRRRPRSLRPPSPAPMTQRSPPSSRRSSATPAELCAHINDHGAPGKHAPFGHCCDQCPLCRFAAQAVAFVPPDVPALPGRLDSDAHGIRAPPGQNVLPAYRAQPNRARAPPLAV